MSTHENSRLSSGLLLLTTVIAAELIKLDQLEGAYMGRAIGADEKAMRLVLKIMEMRLRTVKQWYQAMAKVDPDSRAEAEALLAHKMAEAKAARDAALPAAAAASVMDGEPALALGSMGSPPRRGQDSSAPVSGNVAHAPDPTRAVRSHLPVQSTNKNPGQNLEPATRSHSPAPPPARAGSGPSAASGAHPSEKAGVEQHAGHAVLSRPPPRA
ncbi:MAG: hypothetical protein K8T25_01890 [Planctomycetia bacterium]|nr:hypothetical protein [Planctomycetia bacterium]